MIYDIKKEEYLKNNIVGEKVKIQEKEISNFNKKKVEQYYLMMKMISLI